MVLRKLSVDEYGKLGWFDCGDDDINDFFHHDALLHKEELMAESYCFEYDDRPLALVCIQNDSVQFAAEESRERNSFGRTIGLPQPKRYRSIPAVKLARLGVHKDFAKAGLGTNLLICCKHMFVNENRTGCRLILVDAYRKAIEFYTKNGFVLYPKQTIEGLKEDDTVFMYCDLKPYST